MTEEDTQKQGFWNSATGTITKITTLVVALGGLITAVNETGLLSLAAGSDANEIEGNTSVDHPVCQSKETCFIICESAFPTKKEAKQRLVELSHNGYNNKAGYLWVPDYECFSGQELFQVYIGPFAALTEAKNALCAYNQQFNTTTYGVEVCDGNTRHEFRCD